MALVVTAGPPVEAQAGPAEATLPRTRLSFAVRWLAVVVAAWYAISLVGETLGRLGTLDGGTDDAIQALSACAVLLVVALCAVAWVTRRDDAGLLLAATLAPLVAALRAVSMGLLLTVDLSTLADVLDVGLGLLVLGCLVWAASAAFLGTAMRTQGNELFRCVTDVTAFIMLAVGLTGATVRAVGASWSCQGTFPDCNGLGIMPLGRDPLADIQLYHRLLSYLALALVLWLVVEAFRSQRALAGVTRTSLTLLGTTLLQGGLGIASVSSNNPPLTEVLHMAGAGATLSVSVVLAVLSRRAWPATVGFPTDTRASLRTLAAYVQLTKPRVMSLLLATTATAMVIAARGMPDLGVFVATLLGGALMSGGAGAINHYVDRDIDPLMGRTAWRPIPSGMISPRHALSFGITLAVMASAIFLLFVNPLACLLALLGLLGYVFIYTLWLKRSTPSNIVIGGAAGAIPPLVGWAAVTNEIHSLTAWYLFAIIFFWTPPHFWALSLLIREHYARARVPMLPVVRGEAETRHQIVLYSIVLVVLTLVLSPFGLMGALYFWVAAVLGALFIVYAIQLWRQKTRQAARRLYLYSLLYLFALFAAMAVDRVVS